MAHSLVLHQRSPKRTQQLEEKKTFFWAPSQHWAEQGVSWLEQQATGKPNHTALGANLLLPVVNEIYDERATPLPISCL